MPFWTLICSSLRKEILKEHFKMEETLYFLKPAKAVSYTKPFQQKH